MKLIYFLFCFLGINIVFGQEYINAEKETVIKASIGKQLYQIAYRSNEEGFFSPGSPFVDSRGDIVFYKTINGNVFLLFSNGAWHTLPYMGNLSSFREIGNRSIQSQQGMQIDNDPLFFDGSKIYEYNYSKKMPGLKGEEYRTYPTPFGAIRYSEKERAGIAVVFNTQNPKKEFAVIDQSRLKSWLTNQPGSFSIGDDGLLYRNDVLWSAIIPTSGAYAEKYIGRLISGHQVWVGGGGTGWERYITISNSAKQVEIILDLPWAPRDNGSIEGFNPFDYGLGPWGELYYLIAPFWDQKTPWNPKDGDTSELVVVRNHLKFFGRTNADNVRMRKEPRTDSDVITEIPKKMGFRIIERNGKQETIGGKTSDWTRVRYLDGREGWIFGAFVDNLYDGPGTPPPWPNVPDW